MVDPRIPLSIDFSEEIDIASMPQGAILLEIPGYAAIDFSLSVDGAKAFLVPTHPLDPNQNYRVSVSTAIHDRSGNNLQTAKAWTFRTREARWRSSALLESDDIRTPTEFDLAAGKGIAVAVWLARHEAEELSPSEIWTAIWSNGAWEAPRQLDSRTFQNVFSVSAVIDSQGIAHAMWLKGQLNGGVHLVTSRHDGTKWTNPEVVVQASIDNYASLRLHTGECAAIWSLEGHLYMSRHDARSGWGQGTRVDSAATLISSLESVVSGKSSSMALWKQGNQLLASNFSNGIWSPTIAAAMGTASNISLFYSPGDEASLVWTDGRLFARSFSNSSWGAISQLDTQGVVSPSPLTGKRGVSYLSDGTVMVPWVTGSDVWLSSKRPGEQWSNGTAVARNASPVSLQILSGGTRAMTFWVSSTSAIYASSYNNTTGWQEPSLVNSAIASTFEIRAVHEETSNQFIAVWLQATGGILNVLSSVYQ